MTRKALIILISSIAGFLVVVGTIIGIIIGVNSNQGPEAYRTIKLIDYVGEVYIDRNENEFQVDTTGINLKSGDTLKVKEASSASLKLDEDKYISVMENTTIHLTATGEKGNTKTSIYVEEGGIIGDIQSKLSDSESFDIIAANSVMAIRGTAFLVEVKETQTTKEITFGLYRGETEVNVLQKNDEGSYVNTKLTQSKDDKYTIVINKEEELSKDEMDTISDAISQGSDFINQINCDNDTEKANDNLNNIVINGLELTDDEKQVITDTIEEIKEKAQELIADDSEIDTLVINSYYGIYDGAAHSISTIAPENYVVKYSNDNITFDLDEAPKYTNEGFYTTYVLFTKGDEEYHAYGTVDISKADMALDGYQAKFDAPTGTKLADISLESPILGASIIWENPDYEIVQGSNKANLICSKDNYNDLIIEYTITGVSDFVYTVSKETAIDNKYTYDGLEKSGVLNVVGNPTIKYTEILEAITDIDPQTLTYTDTIPTRVGAGKYYYFFEISGENFNTVYDYAYFEIGKAQITYTANDVTVDYTGGAQYITVSTISGLKILYWNDEYEVFNLAISPRYNNAGVYEIKFIIYDTNDNYEEIEGSATLTINPLKFTVANNTSTVYYDGNSHTVSLSASESDVVYKYGLTEGTYDLDDAPEFVEPGNYKVYIEATKDNYSPVYLEATVAITELEIIEYSSIKENSLSYIFDYDGEAKTSSINVVTEDVTIKYAQPVAELDSLEDYDYSLTEMPSMTDAGVYYIPFMLTKTGYHTEYNYAWFEIDPAEIEYSARDLEVVYDGEPHNILVAVADGFDVKFQNPETLEFELDECPSYTEAGSYSVRIKITHPSGNYQVMWPDYTITIKPQYFSLNNISFQASYTFTGEDITPDIADFIILNKEQPDMVIPFEITDVEVSDTIINAGSYGVVLTIKLIDSNYTFNNDNTANDTTTVETTVYVDKAYITPNDGELDSFMNLIYDDVYIDEALEDMPSVYEALSGATVYIGRQEGVLSFDESMTFEIGKNELPITFIPTDSDNFYSFSFTGYVYTSGLGSEASPINIYNEEQWEAFAQYVNDNSGDYIYAIQTVDLDFTNTSFTPVTYFIGQYDGNNHTITLDSTQQGLFTKICGLDILESEYDADNEMMILDYGIVYSTDVAPNIYYAMLSSISNLTITSSSANAASNKFGFIANEASYVLFDNVNVIDSTINTKELTNDGYRTLECIGGIAGRAVVSSFNNCTVDNLSITDTQAYGIGALAGYSSAYNLSNNTINEITIVDGFSSASYGVGGMIGTFETYNQFTSSNNKISAIDITGEIDLGGVFGAYSDYGYVASVSNGLITEISHNELTDFTVEDVNINCHYLEGGGFAGVANPISLSNTTLTNINIATPGSAGAVIGHAYSPIFESVEVNDFTYKFIPSDSEYQYIGGLIGYEQGEIMLSDCSVDGFIIEEAQQYADDVGGLIGFAYIESLAPNKAVITNCNVTNMNIYAGLNASGFIGTTSASFTDNIEESYPVIENNTFTDSSIVFNSNADYFLNYYYDETDEMSLFNPEYEYNCDLDNTYSNVTLTPNPKYLDIPLTQYAFAYDGEALSDLPIYDGLLRMESLSGIDGEFSFITPADTTFDYGDNIIQAEFTPNNAKYSGSTFEIILKVYSDGSEANPYLVYDEESFVALYDFISYMYDLSVDYIYVTQTADLDFENIDFVSPCFVGTYNGGGYTISNLSGQLFDSVNGIIYTDEHVSLPEAEATKAYSLYSGYIPTDNEGNYVYKDVRYSFVTNLTISNANIEFIEGIYFGFLANEVKYASISHINVTESTILGEEPNDAVGAVIGYSEDSILTYINIEDIEIKTNTESTGGIIGKMMNSEINHSNATSINVLSTYEDYGYTGGIIGYNGIYQSEYIFVGYKKFEDNTITGTEDNPSIIQGGNDVGGMIGRFTAGGRAANSEEYIGSLHSPNSYIMYVSASNIEVHGDNNVGGIVGEIDSTLILFTDEDNVSVYGSNVVGGIAGYAQSGSITNNNANDPLSVSININCAGDPDIYAGGLVGNAYNLDIENFEEINVSYNLQNELEPLSFNYVGGIVGYVNNSSIKNCYLNSLDVQYDYSTVEVVTNNIDRGIWFYGGSYSDEVDTTGSTYNENIILPPSLLIEMS